MTFREPGTDDVENLYARIGTAAPNLVIAGHTDVVPVGDEKAWKHPPFSGEVANGELYGRGAVDMKGGIACALQRCSIISASAAESRRARSRS